MDVARVCGPITYMSSKKPWVMLLKLMTIDDWVELKVYSDLVLRTLVLSALTPS